MKNIVLTGMSGSGKSTVGAILAVRLNSGFADVDFLIEKQEKLSVSEIFTLKGEKYFRGIERRTIENLSGENLVISLGGGAFEDDNTRNLLLNNANVFYLETSADVIFSRLIGKNDRPILKELTLDKIHSMLEKREKHYKLAHYKVLTDNKSPEKIAEEILKCLN